MHGGSEENMADQYGDVDIDDTKYVADKSKNNTYDCSSPQNFELQKYNITRKGRKLAIIINVMNFPGTNIPDRNGAVVDEDVITHLLEGILGFEVFPKRNYCAEDLRSLFIEMTTWCYKEVDTVAIVLMSYGDNREIYAADGETLDINELLDQLKGNNCPALAGKPKLVFINAGPWEEVPLAVMSNGYDEVDSTTADYDQSSNNGRQHEKAISIPNESDIIYIYSPVTFGHRASGNIQQGNIFLTALSEMCLKLQSQELELCDLLTQTNHQVARIVQSASSVPSRPCFFLSTLTKELYLVANT